MENLQALKPTPQQTLDNVEHVKKRLEQLNQFPSFDLTNLAISLDEKGIYKAYKKLQTYFAIIYEKMKKENNQLALKRLDAFRLYIIKRMSDYQRFNKRKEFAEAIQEGVMLVRIFEKK